MTGNNRDYCKNATSPINISMSGIMGPCVLKCDYNYDYGTYSPNITNSRSYLSLNYSGKTNPVKYNDEQYNVTEVRIYRPSLHQYKGNTADGEILIIHNGPGKNLIVSVPFIIGGKTDKGSVQLATLLSEAALRTPNATESVTVSMGNFSLNNFLPNKKGYFSYTGTLPYGTCNGSYSYVVYNIDDALNISMETLEKLNKIISKTTPSIKDNNFFYNKNGANSKGQDDNIYIDCQPVNEDGQLLVQEGTSVQTSQSAKSSGLGIEGVDDGYQMLEGLLIGAILVYGIVFVFKRMRMSSLDAK